MYVCRLSQHVLYSFSLSSVCTLRCVVLCVIWKWHFLHICSLHYRNYFLSVWFDPLFGTWRVCHLMASYYSLSGLLPSSSIYNKVWTACHLHPDPLYSKSFRGNKKDLSVTQILFPVLQFILPSQGASLLLHHIRANSITGRDEVCLLKHAITDLSFSRKREIM